MAQRGVAREEVEEALQGPAQLLYDRGRDTLLALHPRGHIAVVYAQHAATIEVVTVLTRREYNALTRRLGRKRYRVIQ
jgi:hypothetical protein